MTYCDICGGVTTCPATEEIIPLPPGYPKTVSWKYVPQDGEAVSHHRLRENIIIPESATVVGTAQSGRVLAHHPELERVWVGTCSYAFRLRRP